jgi:hypothetical protein
VTARPYTLVILDIAACTRPLHIALGQPRDPIGQNPADVIIVLAAGPELRWFWYLGMNFNFSIFRIKKKELDHKMIASRVLSSPKNLVAQKFKKEPKPPLMPKPLEFPFRPKKFIPMPKLPVADVPVFFSKFHRNN